MRRSPCLVTIVISPFAAPVASTSLPGSARTRGDARGAVIRWISIPEEFVGWIARQLCGAAVERLDAPSDVVRADQLADVLPRSRYAPRPSRSASSRLLALGDIRRAFPRSGSIGRTRRARCGRCREPRSRLHPCAASGSRSHAATSARSTASRQLSCSSGFHVEVPCVQPHQFVRRF